MEKYNDPKNQKTNVDILTDKLISMHRQVLDTADIVNERGEQINLIVSKSEQLSRDSYTFKKTAEKVKNIERWRKIKLYGTIILVLLIIIIAIYLLRGKK
jgi:vesicle-associated membrane protein 7